MSTFAFVFLCIQACLVQSAFSQSCGCGAAGPVYAGPAISSCGGLGLGNGLGINSGLGVNAGLGYSGYGGAAISPAGGYSAVGNGNVAVIGELPISGATVVSGQVPIVGAVQYSGNLPASGSVIISGNCGCGCSGNGNGYYY